MSLRNPKTFNEKIQWLKLYDSTEIKTKLTDKVLVRDWVKEKILESYLKPVLWIGDNFDEIPFNELPKSVIIKANHGCKWHYKIKDISVLNENLKLKEVIKKHFEGWMRQNFFPWAGFELQYKNIIPKIIIEPLMQDNENSKPVEIEIYCFNGKPKIFQKIIYSEPRAVNVYDENYNNLNLKFLPDYVLMNEPADENIKHAVELSKVLAKDFKLVRVDWLIFNNHIYFNEMTFTPFSGFFNFEPKEWNIKLGKLLKLK